jgi:serine phosphatase RsbU (regulator of sigma subunit)
LTVNFITYSAPLFFVRTDAVVIQGRLARTLSLLLFTFAINILMNQRSARLLVERQRLSGELASAAEVQSLLLTSLPAAANTYRIEPVYLPASEVGGDFYQVLVPEDGSYVVLVGDVSGKGLKAAMMVSATIGMLRRENSSSPAAILAGLNDGLAGHVGGGFVTCICARFGPDGSVTIANAGHPSPYCDGREVEVAAGLPLGVLAGVSYEESVVPGERFTFVSDGVVEAENAHRELFGFERTREISTKSAQEIADTAKAWGQNDDITVVTVRRKHA